jgi:hypothetical protein
MRQVKKFSARIRGEVHFDLHLMTKPQLCDPYSNRAVYIQKKLQRHRETVASGRPGACTSPYRPGSRHLFGDRLKIAIADTLASVIVFVMGHEFPVDQLRGQSDRALILPRGESVRQPITLLDGDPDCWGSSSGRDSGQSIPVTDSELPYRWR